MKYIVFSLIALMVVFSACSGGNTAIQDADDNVKVLLSSPQDTVKSFSAAYNSGDYDSLKKTLHSSILGFATSLDAIKAELGADRITLTILDESTSPDNPGMPRISVVNADFGVPGKTTSVTLIEEDGNWLISKLVDIAN